MSTERSIGILETDQDKREIPTTCKCFLGIARARQSTKIL